MNPAPVRRLRAMALLAVALLAVSALARAQPVQIEDDRGRLVSLPRPPQRIVSLLPSLTESLCALGQCQRIVGVDRHSNWPEAVTGKLPRLGSGLDPGIEAVVALRPDVVLLAGSSRASERLQALGLAVVALEPKTHADVHRVLGLVSDLLGVPRAQGSDRLWREIDAGIQAAAQSLPPRARNARVYFEAGRGPYAAGAASFIGETLTRLGARNVVPAALGPFPRLNPEFVLRADPDIIMIGSRGMQAMLSYPGWAGLRAVREQRICVFSPGQSDMLVRPGPRMAEAARIMARCLADKAHGAHGAHEAHEAR
ncbi:ABC transporter substrate-binding protein [Verminephrobacter eiseniae]|uniref:Periplasmic binding protein n=1 Tax=Verminephrobacter eiseniae (strain EF01-2) TaxID=391735 RepID=A1WS60_VEREI|nr:ABC transporter substrate-binding protein [Verminephrobacter eiseniae]ABM60467.1 periplasmic binding protein [Verminephrobacter eiseniae EF01-2]MCW5285942.1 ABC transporter substrate-binding protein [Verminephrobacter eiseniae]MCW5304240.1 ABC transporter substrate-binding protein [Verminephrobacter eiseniae]MCW8181853.1 ABC transporter substrate-binding protein [Verminephrobacter eiseniae]MCW8191827.1 ABC transporter substrate-binding protein [Verminephrobacter eiseniae]